MALAGGGAFQCTYTFVRIQRKFSWWEHVMEHHRFRQGSVESYAGLHRANGRWVCCSDGSSRSALYEKAPRPCFEQSLRSMQKPILFIVHSMGGLVAKKVMGAEFLSRVSSSLNNVRHTYGVNTMSGTQASCRKFVALCF